MLQLNKVALRSILPGVRLLFVVAAVMSFVDFGPEYGSKSAGVKLGDKDITFAQKKIVDIIAAAG
jgi:hypothetical protein